MTTYKKVEIQGVECLEITDERIRTISKQQFANDIASLETELAEKKLTFTEFDK